VPYGEEGRGMAVVPGLDRPPAIRENASVLTRAVRQLAEQLPKTPVARAGAIIYLVTGAVVAVLVPIFFGVMLWGMLTGQGG
jgi:hypothetical protein